MMIKKKLSTLIRIISHFGVLVKGFGLVTAINVDLIPFFRGVGYKHNYILAYLEKKYAGIIDKYKFTEQSKDFISNDCMVWVCWFQGEKNMPESIKYCFESIKKYSGSSRKVQLITSDNYRQFVSLPQYIIDKVEKGQISLTHFGDILRVNLLADYGGIYIDAGLFLTSELQIPALPFFSIKLRNPTNDSSFVSDYRWVAGFMGGGKANTLHSFMRGFFNAYHKRESMLIDYFLVDYVIALAYNEIHSVRDMIDNVPYSNENFYYMERNLFQPVNKKELEQVLKRSHIFKIGYKGFPQVKGADSLYKVLFR